MISTYLFRIYEKDMYGRGVTDGRGLRRILELILGTGPTKHIAD
jgi:hypothetical protein